MHALSLKLALNYRLQFCSLFLATAQVLTAWNYSSDNGYLLIEQFTPEELQHGEFFSDFAEDQFGNVYAGSSKGLHRYDGESWKILPATGYNRFTSAAHVSEDQKIWVGGSDHIGYYKFDSSGEPIFEDLTEELIANLAGREIGLIWEIHSNRNEVCIITSNDVLWHEDGQWIRHEFKVKRRILPTWENGELFIHARGDGLYKINGKSCEKLMESHKELESGIVRVLYNQAQHYRFMTLTNGIWESKDGKLAPILDKNSQPHSKDYTQVSLPLSGQIIIRASPTSIQIIEIGGERIGQTAGDHGTIYEVKRLSDGSLWVGTDQSIFRILPDNPTSLGIDTESLTKRGDLLYVSNGERLTVVDPEGMQLTEVEFQEDQVSLQIISTSGGVVSSAGKKIHLIDNTDILAEAAIERPSDYQLLSRYNKNRFYSIDTPDISRWEVSPNRQLLKVASTETNTLIYYAAEISPDLMLFSNNSNAVGLVDWLDEKADSRVKKFEELHGIEQRTTWTKVMQIGDAAVLATDRGLFEYQHEKKKFKAIGLLNPYANSTTRDLVHTQTDDQQGAVIYVYDESDPAGYQMGFLKYSEQDKFSWEPLRLPGLPELGRIKSLLHEIHEGREILWVGGTKDLYRYDITEQKPHPLLKVNLTSLKEKTEQVTHYHGFGLLPQNPKWRFPQRSLEFNFAAPPARLNSLGYQSRLIGFADQWSERSDLPFREFNNLKEGDYTFEVRAIDEFGRDGPVTGFKFTILPPWYRTPYAYFGYVLLVFSVLTLISRWWTKRLRRRNIELEMMVNQRTSELERSNQQLRRANAVKQDFLASMSHEIRNPLNGILGIARLMRDQAQNSNQDDERLQHLFNCASHLHQLLGEVLDYSSLEAGKLSAKRVSFNPLSLTDEVCSMHRAMAEDKGLELTVHLPELEYEWMSDPVLLRQILINLVSNAIKYTPSGSVEVRLEYSGESATFSVSDTGPGIPEEKQQEIFKKFTRLSKAGESQVAGTGLGLAIASQMAVILGGELTLDSEYKHGARFRLRLRAEQSERPIQSTGNTNTPFSRPLRSLKALVADDMDFNRYINSKLLHQLGATTQVVDSGQTALSELQNGSYDLALLDINMPDMNGIEVVRHYLGDSPVHPPKLIALSAHSTEKMQGDCLEAGFDYFIEKPLEPEKLRNFITRKPPPKAPASGSLLDYLANQNPEAMQQLESRFKESIEKELTILQKVTEQNDRDAQSASLHKIKGLIALRQEEGLTNAFEALDTSMSQTHETEEALEAIIRFRTIALAKS